MSRTVTVFVILVACAHSLSAQIIPFDSSAWEIEAATHQSMNYRGRQALFIKGGSAVLNASAFTNGEVEFDIAFSGERSFSGVRWRIVADGNALPGSCITVRNTVPQSGTKTTNGSTSGSSSKATSPTFTLTQTPPYSRSSCSVQSSRVRLLCMPATSPPRSSRISSIRRRMRLQSPASLSVVI